MESIFRAINILIKVIKNKKDLSISCRATHTVRREVNKVVGLQCPSWYHANLSQTVMFLLVAKTRLTKDSSGK